MNRPRIIPILLLSESGLVKTYQFAKPSYVGDPLNAVRIFNEKEVDELIILDIDASKNKSGPNYTLLQEIAEECFIPLCYGGGVSEVEQMRKLFRIGIEKVAVNSALFQGLELIELAAKEFGSQSVVGSIDYQKSFFGGHSVYSHSNRKVAEKNPVTFAQQMERAGAGELLLTSVDRDGMRAGFDIGLLKEISSALDIPVVACGGGGSLADFKEALEAGCSAAAGGSFFVHQGKHRAVLISYPNPDSIERLLE